MSKKKKKEVETMLTDKQRIKRLEAKLAKSEAARKKSIKAHKRTKAKLSWSNRKDEATFQALMLRKKGMSWVKIAKKVKAPESTVRLATQKRFNHTWLKGRWTQQKRMASEKMDEHTKKLIKNKADQIMMSRNKAFIKKALKDLHLHSYEEYVKSTKSA